MSLEIRPPFSTVIPFTPELLTRSSPFLLFNKPVEAIKTPSPLLSTDNFPFWLITEPETFTEPSVFTSKVFPFPLLIFPDILIPFEPEFVISISPLLKFFIVPEIEVPPFGP